MNDTESDNFDPYGIATATPEVAANTLLCLINQATYLLKRQIERLERDFLEHGGITERLYQKRSEFRNAPDRFDNVPAPTCPQCGKTMRRRTARKGAHEGRPFWGCSAYPVCKGIVPIRHELSDNPESPRP